MKRKTPRSSHMNPLRRGVRGLVASAVLGVSLPLAAAAAGEHASDPGVSVLQPASREWTLAEGETLHTIAEALYPRSKRHQKRFIDATLAANPSLDRGAPVGAGARIAVPDLRRLATPAPSKDGFDRLAVRSDAAAFLARSSRKRYRAASGARTDRLRVSAGTGVDSRAIIAPEELQQRERALRTAMDNHSAAQIVLAARIRQIEAAIANLRRGATRLDPAAPHRVRAVVAADSAPAAPAAAVIANAATRKEPNTYDWPLMALALGAVATSVLVLRSRARRTGAVPIDATEPVEVERLAPAPARIEPRIQTRIEPPAIPAAPAPVQDVVVLHGHEDRRSALELADIMLAFGRVEGAAQTLADYIGSNPHEAVQPWLKLLEVYRGAGMRADFETLAAQLHHAFNVEIPSWDATSASTFAESIEGYPHLIDKITGSWGTQTCADFLDQLLRDNRTGMRSGFPLPVVEQIAFLADVLEARLAA